MYQVTTYSMKSGMFGTNMEKENKKFGEYLDKMEESGWVFVSMTQMNNESKTFDFELVFRHK